MCTSHRVVPAEKDGTFNATGLLIAWLELLWGQESGARIILRFSGKVLLSATFAFVSRLGRALECFSAPLIDWAYHDWAYHENRVLSDDDFSPAD